MHSNDSVFSFDKYQVITARSPLVLLVLSGFLACVVIFGVGVLIRVSQVFSSESIVGQTAIDPSLFLAGGVFSLVIGAAAALIRRYEYISLGLTYKKGEVFKLHLYFLYIFFFLLLAYPAYALILPVWASGGERNMSAVFPVLTILTVLAAWVLRNIWDMLYKLFLKTFSPVDWRLHLDQVHFQRMMRLKFAEVMRYQGPLTLIIIGLQEAETIKNRLSRRKFLRLQVKAMDFINQAVRNLDIVGRISEGQFIATLVHTAGMDARVPAERILKKLTSLVEEGRFPRDLEVRFSLGLASYDQSMSTEEDLIRKAQSALQQAIFAKEGILYL